MDYGRILMYGAIAITFMALGEALWRRQWAYVIDRLLNVGIFLGFLLILYPPPALRGAGPFANVIVPVFVGISAIRGYSQWRKELKVKRGPPSA